MASSAGWAAAWVAEVARVVTADRERLTALDAAIGDADHGANLERGFAAVTSGSTAGGTAGEVLVGVGNTLISRVGGASGPLYGSAFRAMGKALEEPVTGTGFAAAFQAGVEAVGKLGRSAEGDKTMLDALLPASRALAGAVREGCDAREAFRRAAEAALAGARATIPLVARKGRASYLGARSAGHEDPGAASAALIVGALTAAGPAW
ncbi:dihydroxyacetone kinase subunit DhaL [Nonomuraea sp. NBC_01738]|uniref:dihydroxyacetone kinase subunit DhaL n=1 Tax=Nonomuraea sp. NBC_01738 TaxID=2976003 RepID=UPI002E0F2C25|nr:dihydroxyacetone kinase subunit DhaL [Nonomuraea sp. NBC_01738]